jgi:hypothetical protein
VSLHLVPVSQRDAKAFTAMWHRHHAPPRGMKFAVGAADGEGVLRAVAIAGRPVARLFDDGRTLEVTRVTSDGTPNACSMLYGACRRAAFALGWTRLLTYRRAGREPARRRLPGDRRAARATRMGPPVTAPRAARLRAHRPHALGSIVTDLEEDRRAIAALVHRLRRDHGDVKPLGADAEPFAQEFVAALRAGATSRAETSTARTGARRSPRRCSPTGRLSSPSRGRLAVQACGDGVRPSRA